MPVDPPVRILVSAASRHGGTQEIAERIAAQLEATPGCSATLLDPEAVDDLDRFDAAVLGSGVYAGSWLGPARDLLERHAASLRTIPVWVFSSGLSRADDGTAAEPAALAEHATEVDARGHAAFLGRLDRTRLGIPERILMRLMRAPAGDFRDWDHIEEWTRQVAAQLTAPSGSRS